MAFGFALGVPDFESLTQRAALGGDAKSTTVVVPPAMAHLPPLVKSSLRPHPIKASPGDSAHPGPRAGGICRLHPESGRETHRSGCDPDSGFVGRQRVSHREIDRWRSRFRHFGSGTHLEPPDSGNLSGSVPQLSCGPLPSVSSPGCGRGPPMSPESQPTPTGAICLEVFLA